MSKIILFALLVSSTSTASDYLCPPVDTQSQCYLDLCKNAKDNIVPLTSEGFQNEMKNFSFEPPAQVKKDLASYVAAVKRFQEKRTKFLNGANADAIAKELTSDFMDNADKINRIVSGKISFTSSNGKFDAIVSDLSPSQSAFYKKLAGELITIKEMVADFKKRAWSEWTPIIFLKFYPLMTEYYKNHPSPNQAKLEESRNLLGEDITAPGMQQKIIDGMIYKDIFKMMDEKFQHVRPMLATAFKNFRTEMKASDTPKVVEENFLRSCKIAQYFLDKTKGRDLQAEYEKAQKNSLEKMKTIFLPMLSRHTRDFVLSKMDKDLFVPLTNKPDIYPNLKELVTDMDDIEDLELNGYFDSEDSLKQDLDERTCDSTVFIPDGSYRLNKILIPFSTIAMGHGDTVTHEVGHWLSSILGGEGVSPESKKNLLALRACITSFYKEPGPSMSAVYKNDGFKTEEDFADWFDFSMNGDMKSHFTCDFTKMVPMFTHFIAGDKIPPIGDLYNPVPNNNHSNDVFRELHELLVKGKPISEACSKLMEQSPDAPKACKL